jgi:lipid-binding SYLF domain-containing protein
VGEGDGRKAVRDLATLISITTGLPASAVARPLGYAVGTSENKIAPTGPVDTVRGLVTGTPSPESKR